MVKEEENSLDPLEALSIDLYKGRREVHIARLVPNLILKGGNWKALALIRLAQLFHRRGNRRRASWAANKLRREFGCFVQPGAIIGPGLRLPHPNGIVIGKGARIGAGCTLYHQVTLGGARSGDYHADRYPHLGDEVTVFSGAKLIGAIQVGDGAIVGANAVVTSDVPPRHTAVGVPARCYPIVSPTEKTADETTPCMLGYPDRLATRSGTR